MKPRASMPTTLSTTVAPDSSRPASARACTTAVNAAWSASSGVMSLKTIPGSGKSGTSRTSRSRTSRAPVTSRATVATSCRAWTSAAGSAAAVRTPGCRPPVAGSWGRSGRGRPPRVRGSGATRASGSSSSSLDLDRRQVGAVLVVDRHLLGERRHRRVRVGLTTGPGLGAPLGEHDLALPGLQVHQERGGDEDRGVDAGRGADEQREREVLQRAGAELERTDVEDRRRSG